MQYSKNYKMNLPELADQFNLKHQNENTEKIDTQMKANADAISAEITRATQKENSLSSAISTETNRAKEKENSLSSSISTETTRATQKENAINSDLTSHKNNKSNPHSVTTSQIGAVPKERKVNNHPLSSDVTVTKGDVGLGNVDDKSFKTMAQALFDMEHPIGKKGRIIQYAWEDEPNTKYNNALISSTWKPVTEYDGKFFKIDSTQAVGTETPESLPNIKGKAQGLQGVDKTGIVAVGEAEGCIIPKNDATYSWIMQGITGRRNNYYNGFLIDASKSNPIYKDPVDGKPVKVQPDNISIKVWERTK